MAPELHRLRCNYVVGHFFVVFMFDFSLWAFPSPLLSVRHALRIQQWRKHKLCCSPAACDLWERRATAWSHHLCIITTVIRAVRMHGKYCPGASRKASWRKKASMNWTHREWRPPVCQQGKERKKATHSRHREQHVLLWLEGSRCVQRLVGYLSLPKFLCPEWMACMDLSRHLVIVLSAELNLDLLFPPDGKN